MKRFYSIFIFLFCSINVVNAQAIDSMMRIHAEQYPQQKVYVHFDKSIYRAGESIWFKAYLFTGFLPASNSRSFYAELIDAKGNVVQRKIYPVSESSASGNFDIPDNFAASSLTFRGYTSWMLNFDSAYHFTKELSIINKAGGVVPALVRPANVSLRFFPEGGDLVNTLESVVAFKANDNHGLPVKISGDIKNQNGQVVASLNTLHDGMGTFKLTPVMNDTYTAIYKDDAGIERTAALPLAKNEGIVLKISSVENKRIFVVSRTANAPENLKALHIVAHIAQQLVYKAKIPLQKSQVNSGIIATDQHPSGLIQFTIFSEDWKPLAERISMLNNNDYLFNASVNSLLIDVNKRARNVLEIEVGDSLLSNLSLAVTDEKIRETPGAENIISRLMLTGDLKGYVHNPAYYFTDSVAFKNLDLVVLTNGWRRYNWGNVVMKKTPTIKFPDTAYLALNAKVYGLGGSTTLRNDESIVAVVQDKDSGSVILQMPKTGADIFSVPNMVFYDTVQVHYQFVKNRRLEKKLTIRFDNGLYKGPNKVERRGLPLVMLAASDSAVGRARFFGDQIIKFGSSWGNRGNILETVVVKTRARTALEILDKDYTSGLFSQGDAYTFDLLNERMVFNNVFAFIQSRVPGIRVTEGGFGGQASINWRNSPTAVFVNEMQMDADYLSTINVNDIAYIKVFRPPFFGSFGGGAGGAIAIYTRKGGEAYRIPGMGMAFDKVAGYDEVKEFYSPDYSTRSSSADVVADYRSTLYWNPVILTGAGNQKVKIEFYNNDITTAFRVVLEGVNEEGRLVRIEKVFKKD